MKIWQFVLFSVSTVFTTLLINTCFELREGTGMRLQEPFIKREGSVINEQLILSNKTVLTTRNLDRQYVIPVHLDWNGPNCQYQAFRAGMKYALSRNQTLTEMYFFNHWTAGVEFSGRKFLNETFDVKRIREVVDLISVDEFRRLCNGAVGVVIFPGHCRNLNETYRRVSVEFNAVYGIKLPKMHGQLTYTNKELSLVDESHNIQCVGLFEPDRGCQVQVTNTISMKVDLHLTRPREIRTLAEQITKRICNGGTYIAMHYRNKSGENFAHPGSRYNARVLEQILKEVPALCKDVRKFMVQRKIDCIYVAFPNFSSSITKMLKDAGVENILTRENITNISYPINIKDQIRLDNYYLALLETELCIRSAVFLSSTESALSRIVTFSRLAKPEDNITIPLYQIKTWV